MSSDFKKKVYFIYQTKLLLNRTLIIDLSYILI